MSRPATTTGSDRLLHCSPERTLFATVDAASGERVACKLLVRGSLHDAEREVAIGARLAHLDVVRHLRAGIDALANRPCVITALHDGQDLDALVGARGALPAAEACAVLLPVARTLAAMHALRSADAPHGFCHGDVKPANLLRTATTTLLLDFEHAGPIAGPPAAGHRGRTSTADAFTGGTRGWAPPEAAAGAPPDAAFDVFGLGATLRWLLDGGAAKELPQHDEVVALVRACTADDPRQRPGAAAVAQALAELAPALAADRAEAVLHDLARGDPAAALRAVESLPERRRNALRLLAHARLRLLARRPELLEVTDQAPQAAEELWRALRRTRALLARFPRHEALLRWRRALAEATGRALATAASHAGELRRAEQFEAAQLMLAATAAAAAEALAAPGRCPIPAGDEPRAVGLLHRDPPAFLRQQIDETAEARRELEAETAAITTAEQRLDLVAAELAIDRMAKRYGGTSATAARRRDQLHRLAFYLDRAARAQPNIDRVAQSWDATALQPLRRFAAACAATLLRTARDDSPSGIVGLRSLQVTLVNLVEEFPHLYAETGPALDALTQALAHTTDQSWELLAGAQQQLKAVPVPVRPLQTTLARLDTFRILEAFVDRPGRPRSQLQDGIESLRLVLEQARATRDRLAHGAEQAMARGHWTTGLFDMERAVNELDDADRGEAQRLRDRLAEARRRKQELEAAVRRNVELQTRYGLLQDDATSSFRARLQVLAERRDCLHFLAVHLPADRGALYARDLREVETQIALEHSGLAESELDGLQDPPARLRHARGALERLSTSVAGDDGGDVPGRLQRLLDHWRTVVAQCQREVEQLDHERTIRLRQRRRLVAVAGALLLVAVTAVGFAVAPWLARPTAAGSAESPSVVAADPTTALQRLARDAAATPATARLFTVVQAAHEAPAFAPGAWHSDLAAALAPFADPALPATARHFAARCWQVGLVLASRRVDPPQLRPLLDRAAELAAELEPSGIRLPRDFCEQVRTLRQ